MSEKRTPALEAATNALLEQYPVSPDVFASLTPAERAEMRSLGRTAVLLQSSLAYDSPAPESEQKALEKAQVALAKSPQNVPLAVTEATPWWRFWRRKP